MIAVCDNAHEELTGPVRPRLHWSVPDPVRVNIDAAFDACPVFPGIRYENWDLDDPAGLNLADVRSIRDEIERRV
ncbi:hypothetical protein [Micromonospora cremea]|uniref:hypothetical protein n=1 Tax=Micromonospora cremea TaxID=709881 RepID=UPI000A477DAC|nr:hypothetical protein [Micromonospora cremea]